MFEDQGDKAYMIEDRVVAQGHFTSLFREELRRRRVSIPEFAVRNGRRVSLMKRVVEEGKPELCREYELRKLINVFFRAGTMKRNKALRLMERFLPSQGHVEKPKYNNRKMCRRGKLRH